MRESNFAILRHLILGTNFDPILKQICTNNRPQEATKSVQKSLHFLMKLNVDFDAKFAPTWTHVGSMLASKIDQKSLLEARTLPLEPPGPLEIRFSLFWINF